MESKQLWMIIGISLVVALITSFATANIVSKNITLSPSKNTPQNIRANSCDADGSCEANKFSITSNGMQRIEMGQNLEINDTLFKNYIATNDRSISLVPNVEGLFGTTRVVHTFGIMSFYHPDYPEWGSLLVGPTGIAGINPNETILLKQRLKIGDMYTGGGNSYVCVDGTGELFRSDEPCV
ncbi:MAG TPA: hypothetical protein VJH65_03235 [Candidatus Nanoarchaeia archaeon]|nr:hypothetical protein [Candidatus Nanoarchaeia archaeon]